MATKKERKKENGNVPASEAHRVYTMEVDLIGGPVSEAFWKKNPTVRRTIEIREDRTLAVLHNAIFGAFEREDEHLYEFQLGCEEPMDPNAKKYVPAFAFENPFDGETEYQGDTAKTSIGSLGLREGDIFFYWFDFGDDWFHRIRVAAIETREKSPMTPKIVERIGKSPPQYA